MIITCPECSTRYDVDDDRFQPDGNSVRCSSCSISWFVPAPETLNAKPLPPEERANRSSDNVDDDSLFAEVLISKKAEAAAKEKYKKNADDEPDGAETEWKKGKKFILQDEEEEETERRPFFALRGKKKASEKDTQREPFFSLKEEDEHDEDDRAKTKGSAQREAYFSDNTDKEPEDSRDRRDYQQRDDNHDDRHDERHDDRHDDREPRIVDADWEAVDEDGIDGRQRGFGQRVRQERRRATAVARVEPIDSRYFDEEFFAALRVQPKELERALRKARRRAEAREKNRMTPLRALGWSAWIGAIAASVFAVIVYREAVVEYVPRSAEVYDVFGVDVGAEKVSITDVRHRLAMSTTGPTIEITGKLLNESSTEVVSPKLQAEAFGAGGELLSQWTFDVAENKLVSNAAAEFVTRAPAPAGVVAVALSFAPDSSTIEN